ncbi:hypothetical protein [uncultured Flavonifractor sp.]|uniref:hypothetical protein n=1 Tax=uncultured Flavonifractor sp. TaxID=1193534 RepID=UPI002595EDAD|nr:hypothetical protein [uncultured Flavonifractor sp.]
MFDTKNEQRRVHVDSAPPKAGSTDAKLKRQFIAIAVIAGVLSAALILLAILSFFRGNGTAEVIDDGGIGTEEQDDGFFGLRNPGHLADLDPTTAEDLQDEFEARPPVTEADEDSFGRSIAGYLSRGDFAGLDGYLREQEATYRGPADSAAETMDDWSVKFPMLRSDVQNAMNLIAKKVEDPAQHFRTFSDPAVLAAALVWSPLTMKVDAFLDYSALILPPPDAGTDTGMEEHVYERPQDVLAGVSEMTGAQYLDVKAYDMTVTGHLVRVVVVMDQSGYWKPWTVQDLGGTLDAQVWNKSTLEDAQADMHYENDIDGVFFLSPPDEPVDKEVHPDWFAQDGVYVGPAEPPAESPDAGPGA